MSDAFVFSGPTLSIADIPASVAVRHDEMLLLENGKKISFMPPVSEGDILKILNNAPDIIAIIDGYFENTPSVWHKEILYAMKNGVHVLGASSMGALRAAELAAFGMEGVGKIYKYYASGDLQDDDEVTITHGPRELGYAQSSEAMVNIRETVKKSIQCGILGEDDASIILCCAKNTFYKKRNYRQIIENSKKMGLDSGAAYRFMEWSINNRVDLKKKDAVSLIKKIIRKLNGPLEKKEVLYSFEETIIWRNARSHV